MEKSMLQQTDYKYGFSDDVKPKIEFDKGLSPMVIRQISDLKDEPRWLLDYRINAYKIFLQKSDLTWGADLSGLDFNDIRYYVSHTEKSETNWDDVPDDIKNTFDRLGIPEAEQKFLSGAGGQYDSEVVYHDMKEELTKLGVIFSDPETAFKEHPDIFKEYFGTVIPSLDNKFAALNSAVWSGGSFIYVPKGVKIDYPLQAYFRINSESMGQFERTLIIADEGSQIHYVEGCTAPTYTSASLHSAVVEIICKKNSRVRYTTIQNWSGNVYNLVTKRAIAEEGAVMEWVDGNLGSRVTMKYPSVYLNGEGAHGEVLSIAFAGDGQHQDAGGKIVHNAPNTTSKIISKSISKNGGRTSYRGLIKATSNATNCKSNVVCDALMLDENSQSDTYPYIEVDNDQVTIEHEARVSKIGEEQLFYMMSRGLTEEDASAMIVNGFIEPLVKELPMEYAVELNKLIQKIERRYSNGSYSISKAAMRLESWCTRSFGKVWY